MKSSIPSCKDVLLILRCTRLGRIPPAQYGAELLADAGVPLVVAEFGEVKPPPPEPHATLRKIRYSVPPLRFLPRALRSIFQWAYSVWTFLQLIGRHGKPRLILAHGLQEQAIALILSWTYRIPFVVHVHEIARREELSGFNRWIYFFEGPALRRAEFTIFPEAGRQKIYVDRYGLKNTSYLVYNCPRLRKPPAPRELRKELGLPDNTFLLGYLGGIGRQNFLEEAITAVAQVAGTHLVVMGGWGDAHYVQSLERRAREEGCAARLHVIGPVENKWEYLATCDLGLCLYSEHETRMQHQATASNKLTESIAAGLPVLVRPTPDFQSFIDKYPVGYVLPQFNAQGIAAGLKYCVEDRTVLKRWSENAFAFHQSELNYEHQFAGVLKLFLSWFPSRMAKSA